MMHIRLPLAASTLALATVLSACTTVVRPAAQPAAPRVVYRDMPAPIVEAVPPPPGPGMHWVPGHWTWQGNGWRWAAGHYVAQAVPPMPAVIVEPIPVAPSPAHVWVRGHWRWNGSGWVWTGGRWVTG